VLNNLCDVTVQDNHLRDTNWKSNAFLQSQVSQACEPTLSKSAYSECITDIAFCSNIKLTATDADKEHQQYISTY